MLFNVMGGPDLTMSEIDEAASIIAKSVDPDADIIFGAVIDDKMMDQIKITLKELAKLDKLVRGVPPL